MGAAAAFRAQGAFDLSVFLIGHSVIFPLFTNLQESKSFQEGASGKERIGLGSGVHPGDGSARGLQYASHTFLHQENLALRCLSCTQPSFIITAA